MFARIKGGLVRLRQFVGSLWRGPRTAAAQKAGKSIDAIPLEHGDNGYRIAMDIAARPPAPAMEALMVSLVKTTSASWLARSEEEHR